MPKKNKRTKLIQANTNKTVTVNSRTYGKHTRAARGSKTPAVLNDVLTAHAERTSVINKAAKAVYDVLKFYSEDFREGQLWQGILSRMRRANNLHFETFLKALDGLDLNSRYALERFGNVPMFAVEIGKHEIQFEMKPYVPPHLHKKDNCYYYSLIVLLFNNKGVCVQQGMQATEWIDKKDILRNKVFRFQKPAGVKFWLLCLELNGGVDGAATNTLASRGMMIVKALR